jgi:MFS family permease
VNAALVLVTVSEGVLLSIVPSTAAGIGQLLHISPGSLNWINTVQLLTTGVCTPVFSRLGDIRGHRQVLRAAVLLTAAGSVLMALAPGFAVLLTGRALQGPAGAFTPLAIGILRDRAGTSRLRCGTAAVVAGASAGAALGFLGSAQLYRATGSVRDVLWIPAACSAAAAAAAFAFVPQTRRRTRRRMDWPGAVTLSAGLAVLLLALASGGGWGWASGRTAGALTASLVLLAALGGGGTAGARPADRPAGGLTPSRCAVLPRQPPDRGGLLRSDDRHHHIHGGPGTRRRIRFRP